MAFFPIKLTMLVVVLEIMLAREVSVAILLVGVGQCSLLAICRFALVDYRCRSGSRTLQVWYGVVKEVKFIDEIMKRPVGDTAQLSFMIESGILCDERDNNCSKERKLSRDRDRDRFRCRDRDM